MVHVLGDRILETATTTGTGARGEVRVTVIG